MERPDELETLSDGAQHPKPENVNLEKPEFLEIVLVPLNDRAQGHGGILDRRQFAQRTFGYDETADMLGQVPREAEQGFDQAQQAANPGACRIEAGFGHAFGVDFPAVPPMQRSCEHVEFARLETERLADIADRALRPVGDHRRGQGRTFTGIFAVDVLNDLLPSLVLVLEIDIDIGRLVAFP